TRNHFSFLLMALAGELGRPATAPYEKNCEGDKRGDRCQRQESEKDHLDAAPRTLAVHFTHPRTTHHRSTLWHLACRASLHHSTHLTTHASGHVLHHIHHVHAHLHALFHIHERLL